MYLSTEVKLMTSLITVFAWRTGLAKEAAGIDEKKKQFQQTGLNTVEVMNNICSIENGTICSVYSLGYHFQAKWVEYFRSYVFSCYE